MKFFGTNLAGITNVVSSSPKLRLELQPAPKPELAQAKIEAAPDLPRGAYEISVRGPGGESGKVKVFVDDLRQETEAKATNAATLPVSFWGVLDTPADNDEFRFGAKAGETLVFDLAVKSLGSKIASPSVSVIAADGAVLDSERGFDGGDQLLVWRVPADGRYAARVADAVLGSSKDHFYRLSVGALPVVTGIFPLSVGTNAEAEVELIGVNLPVDAKARVKAAGAGEVEAPIDAEKLRARRAFKVLVAAGSQLVEQETNNAPAQAMPVPVPGAVNGRIERIGDADLFRFEATSSQSLIIETDASRRGSPMDTKIEVLHLDGKPVTRLLLQAVRDSAITFRGIDSTTTDCRVENWEEMELNELLYLQGEVVKLFRAPQGPDSGFLFYAGAGGKRRTYFDTSATAHALDEPCYTVEPRAPGTKLVATGLPVFTLHYANDDDGERQLVSDSRLHFTAPTNGSYLVRVTDTRGHGGDTFAYRLVLREARPDFKVTLGGANPTIAPGSGQSFTVTAERIDGFDGEIKVDIAGLPAGFTVSTPVLIQAGHSEAKGALHAALDAPKPGTNATRVTATATLGGKTVTKDVNNLGVIKLGDKPKLWVSLNTYDESATNHFNPTNTASAPIELTVAPGGRIPAWLKIHRNGHADLVTFFVEGLPHGVIVDDIGLNGVLIPKGENERQIFLNCAKWVPEQDRWCYAIEQQAGKQTSTPVLLKVRRPLPKQAASAK